MGQYQVTGPDGGEYQFEAATDEEAAAAVDELFSTAGGGQPQQAPPAQSAPAQPDPAAVREAFSGGFDPSQDSAATARGIARSLDYHDAYGGKMTFGNSMLLEAGDEIGGTLAGALEWVKGGDFDEGYDRHVGRMRNEMDLYARRNPASAMAAQVAGAIPSVLLPGGAAVRGASVGAKMLRGAVTGGVIGGATGYAAGEGGIGNRAANGAVGAGTGVTIGAGAPLAAGATKWVAQHTFGRPLAALANAAAPQARARRALRQAVTDDAAAAGISPQHAANNIQQAQRSGSPMMPLDVGESTRQLGRTAANLSPQGRDVLNQAVDQRFTTQADRVIDTITASAPGVNADATRAALQNAARVANQRNYDAAYRAPGANAVWNRDIETLTVSPDMQAAIRDATRIGANEAAVRGQRPPRNPFNANADGSISPVPGVAPTLEFWDHVKRSIDGQIGIQQRAGNREYVGQLTQLKNQLVAHLDRAVPAYRQARQTAASFFGSDDALEAGRLFVRRTGDNAGVRQAIGRMSRPERRLFAEGFATQVIEDVRNIPDRLTVINKIFQSPAARERFELALGRPAVDAMEITMRAEAIMDLGRRAVQGNSTTAQQLIAQGLLGTGAGAAMTGGDFTDPKTYLIAALTMGFARGARAGMDRANQRMARELANLLASGDPQAVSRALQGISRRPQALSALRNGHVLLTRALQPAVSERMGTAPATSPSAGEAAGR